MTKQEKCALAVLGLALAGGLAYLATRAAGPVPLNKNTEDFPGGLAEKIVTSAELGYYPGPRSSMQFPVKVAPGLASLLTEGFRPLYFQPCDPQIAALPMEQD